MCSVNMTLAFRFRCAEMNPGPRLTSGQFTCLSASTFDKKKEKARKMKRRLPLRWAKGAENGLNTRIKAGVHVKAVFKSLNTAFLPISRSRFKRR